MSEKNIYRAGPSDEMIEAMLKSDVPMIREQAREIIRSQGIKNIDMGQNQFMQNNIIRPREEIDFRQRDFDAFKRMIGDRKPEGIEKVMFGLNQLYNPVDVGPFSVTPLNVLGAFSPVPYVPQLTALSGIVGAAKGLGQALQDRFGIAGVPTVDRFGNLFTGAQLDRMNALGGYYSDPARQSRQRDRRITNLTNRMLAGKSFSQRNLDRLLEQQRQEEAARQSAAAAIQQQNREEGTGGYQSDFASDSDFMEGSGTSAEMGSFARGGIVGIF